MAAVVAAAGALALAPIETAGTQEAGEAPVLVALTATGSGVSTYPDFDPSTPRFGIRTRRTTRAITVTATTETAGDQLTVAGLPTASGQARVFTGLHPGEEITVEVANGNGSRTYGLVYLPRDFPIINITEHQPGIAAGRIFLSFFVGPPFLVVLDNNGVPLFVNRRPAAAYDFKPQPTGQYVFLERTDDLTSIRQPIYEAVVLDLAMQEVARYRTVGLQHTDLHDVQLLPGGHRLLLAYEPTVHNGVTRVDGIVQEVDAGGHEVLRWSTWGDVPLADSLSGNPVDYAHLNSVVVDTDGNLLASLRGVSAVVKIDRDTGELIWTLGGRSSDFTIDDPLGSFCGQHTAERLPNGHLLLFDNGVDCPPNGGNRGVSRAAEYALDEVNMTAELVWSHSQGIYGFATGSTQRLANGNTLIDWGTAGVITEVDDAGRVVFEMSPRFGTRQAGSYRAYRAPFPDAIRPRVLLSMPPAGTTYVQGRAVRARYLCVDEGGSSVASCEGTVPSGALLDTATTGPHSITVTATDGAGNGRELTRTYQVSQHQPDVAARRGADGRLVGNGVYNRNGDGQTRISRVGNEGRARFTVEVGNDGVVEDTFEIRGTPHNPDFAVRYFDGADDVTAAVKAGTYRLRGLQPGAHHNLRVEVTARPGTSAGAHLNVFVAASSLNHPARRDVAKLVTRRV